MASQGVLLSNHTRRGRSKGRIVAEKKEATLLLFLFVGTVSEAPEQDVHVSSRDSDIFYNAQIRRRDNANGVGQLTVIATFRAFWTARRGNYDIITIHCKQTRPP